MITSHLLQRFISGGIVVCLLMCHCSTSLANTKLRQIPPVISLLMDDVAICGNAKVEAEEVCDDGNGFDGDFCSSDCSAEGPLAYLRKPGRWGTPDEVLILPGNSYNDIQAAFPNVNWQTLDRLYVRAGTYNKVRLVNLPNRSAAAPLIITNYGGQVIVKDNFDLQGGSNWVLTGRYDSVSKTGHKDFLGHAGGRYPLAQGNYGIYLDKNYTPGHGVSVRGGASDFELEFIEVAEAGFSGINIKNDDSPDAHMHNVMIHDLYIRDTEAECMYIGNTAKGPNNKTIDRLQHHFENLKVFNNRGVRCGAEGLQLSHIGDGGHVFNNVFFVNAMEWKDPFQGFQEGLVQVYARPGNSVIENNIFIGSSNSMLSLRALADITETPKAGDTLLVRNNYFSHSRGSFFSFVHYFSSNTKTTFHFDKNRIGEIVTQRGEVHSSNTEPTNYFFENKNNDTANGNPLVFTDNQFDSSRRTVRSIPTLNGQVLNARAAGNSRAAIPQIQFANSGFAHDFDYRKIEIWSDCSGVYGNQAINYELDDVVSLDGHLFRLKKALPATAYNCSYANWAPCRGLNNTVSYSRDDIISTHGERHYKLIAESTNYLCDTKKNLFNNTPPRLDPDWQEVSINAVPGSAAGAEWWEPMALPVDDLRLSPDSEFQDGGLLDVIR